MNELARTRAVIESGIQQGLHLGAQIYVSLAGEVLLEAACGHARESVPMRGDSITLWFSAGKPLTAVAIGQLVERGALAWNTPVAEVIPEFAQHGKERVTIQHLLTHTAGLRNADHVNDSLTWDEKLAWICAQPLEPDWVPGKRAGYHLTGTWYVLGEIVRRRTGMALDDYLRVNLFGPLRMNATSLTLAPEEIHAFGNRVAFVYDTSTGSAVSKTEWNSDEGLERCRPGGSARGPVRELGRFYEALLNDGRPVIRAETAKWITSRQRDGMFDETFQFRMDWGLGFIISSNRDGFQMPYGYGRRASRETFGHSGNQASCAFVDPQHRLVVAWACNGMPGERKHQQRQRAINNAIYEDLRLTNDDASA